MLKKTLLRNNEPMVLFDDFALFIRLGQALNILSEQQINEYSQMLATLLEKGNSKSVAIPSEIPSEVIDKVSSSFSKLLNKIGIEPTETCILKNLDEEYFTFKCILANSNQSIDINLMTFDEKPNCLSSLTVMHSNLIQKYIYINPTDNCDADLQLASRQIFEGELYHYSRYFSPFACQITLYTPDYNLELLIKPNKENLQPNQIIFLPNENILEQNLCALRFPCDMLQVIDSIIDTIGSCYQEIKIKIQKRNSSCFELERNVYRYQKHGIQLEMSNDEIRMTLSTEINWKEYYPIISQSGTLKNESDKQNGSIHF